MNILIANLLVLLHGGPASEISDSVTVPTSSTTLPERGLNQEIHPAFQVRPIIPPIMAQGKPGKRKARGEKRRKKIQKRIRALRAWKISEALDLGEARAAKLWPILSKYDRKFHKNWEAIHKARKALRAEANSKNPNSTKVNKLIDNLIKKEKKRAFLRQQRFSEVRKVLTPVQAAKLTLVLENIDRRIRGQIKKAMEKHPRHKRGPGPRRHRGMGGPGRRHQRR